MTSRRRGVVFLCGGAALMVVPFLTWGAVAMLSADVAADSRSTALQNSDTPPSVPVPADFDATAARSATPPSADAKSLLERAKADPSVLWEESRVRYLKNVKAYRCILTKQELLPDGISPNQEIEVRYQASPESVYMLWRTNITEVKRVLYVDHPDFKSDKGEPMVRVEPAGSIVRLFVTDTKLKMSDPRTTKASRRNIREISFLSTLELFRKYHERAKQMNVVELHFLGESSIDGRPTYQIERFLPYSPNGPFPDAKLIAHFDQETLLPIALYSFSDREGKNMLGSYVFTKIEINPPFDEKSFQF